MTNTTWNSDETIAISTINDDNTIDIELHDYAVDTIDISSITTFTGSTIDTITLEDPHWADNITWEQTEFVDKMPSIDKVHNMCGYYPALEKAYENFKTIYKMVEQDYKGNHQENDETPF